MKKSISTSLTNTNIARITFLLAETPSKLEALSKPLTSEQLIQALGDGERSFAETLVHLINSEARTSEAIYLALLVDEPLIADIHPERDWGKLLRFDLLEFNDLTAYFKLRRTVLLRALSSLKEDGWSRCIREKGKKRKESVYWRARSLALHEAEHVSELERKVLKRR